MINVNTIKRSERTRPQAPHHDLITEPRDKQHRRKNERQNDGRGKIGLCQNKGKRNADQHKRSGTAPVGIYFFLVPHKIVSQKKDHQNLDQLGRLELKSADLKPALRTLCSALLPQ